MTTVKVVIQCPEACRETSRICLNRPDGGGSAFLPAGQSSRERGALDGGTMETSQTGGLAWANVYANGQTRPFLQHQTQYEQRTSSWSTKKLSTSIWPASMRGCALSASKLSFIFHIPHCSLIGWFHCQLQKQFHWKTFSTFSESFQKTRKQFWALMIFMQHRLSNWKGKGERSQSIWKTYSCLTEGSCNKGAAVLDFKANVSLFLLKRRRFSRTWLGARGNESLTIREVEVAKHQHTFQALCSGLEPFWNPPPELR